MHLHSSSLRVIITLDGPPKHRSHNNLPLSANSFFIYNQWDSKIVEQYNSDKLVITVYVCRKVRIAYRT